MTSNRSKEWEKQTPKVVREIIHLDSIYDNDMAAANMDNPEDILIKFIRSLLAEHNEEIIERVEKIKKYGVIRSNHCGQCEALVSGFEVACDEVIQSIKGEEMK